MQADKHSGGRVLIVAFYYPPNRAVGAIRPAGLAKYLRDFGWEAVVLTPEVAGRSHEHETVIETGYRDIIANIKRTFHLNAALGLHQQLKLPVSVKPNGQMLHTRLLTLLKHALVYPDATKGWVPFAMQAALTFTRQQRIHAILTTAPPFTTHLVGARLRRALDCPWVADYRDLWTFDRPQMTIQRQTLVSRLRQHTERKIFVHADALVTVSEPWAQYLKVKYPRHRVYTIKNGFDPDDVPSTQPAVTPQFTITHTGQLYEGGRDPSELFDVVRDLIREGALPEKDVVVRFYGSVEPFMPALVSEFGLERVVQLCGRVPRAESLARQAESQLLLLLTWWHSGIPGWVPGKLFEYLAARRPIVGIGGGGEVVSQILAQTKAGRHVQSKFELRALLLRAYHEFRACGYVRYHGDQHAIDTYTHRNMAQRFATVLDTVTGRAPSAARLAV